MGLMSRSLASCLEEVPVAIMLWKPEQAPQATVINSAGNRGPSLLDQPVNAGISKVIIRNTPTEYTEIDVSDWIENDDSLSGVFGY